MARRYSREYLIDLKEWNFSGGGDMGITALVWIASALIAAAIGSKKGETGTAFIVGLIFGPFGVLFALVSTGNRIPCPYCKERINKKAEICPHCRSSLTQPAPPSASPNRTSDSLRMANDSPVDRT